MNAGTRIVRLMIGGRVHGVGFRAFIEAEALRRKLRGWVRNRRDGFVEATIAGPPVAVEAMIEACRRGPPAARVDSLDVQEEEQTALEHLLPGEEFSVLRTV
ncbi:MAG: acylphosphatase [Bradyrhizobiaceae bacterium]|nr:acylphosphatase [Bradyrhizobiaceae bacterium]